MDAVNKLLDTVREVCSLESDGELAARLDVSRQLVSQWRKGRSPIPDPTVARLCALAKIDGGVFAAAIHAERATDPTERAMWRSMLDRLRPIAAAVGLVALGMAWNDGVSAREIQADVKADALCIMRNVRRWLRSTLARFPTFRKLNHGPSPMLAGWLTLSQRMRPCAA